MIHELKTWKPVFQAMKAGYKTFDLRKNDRNFKVGDTVILKEYDNKTNTYTGDHIRACITYILPEDNPFLNLGDFVILSLEYRYVYKEINNENEINFTN